MIFDLSILSFKPSRFYLMHGTSPDGALGITDGGFRLDLTGSHAGTMFGSLAPDSWNAMQTRTNTGSIR